MATSLMDQPQQVRDPPPSPSGCSPGGTGSGCNGHLPINGSFIKSLPLDSGAYLLGGDYSTRCDGVGQVVGKTIDTFLNRFGCKPDLCTPVTETDEGATMSHIPREDRDDMQMKLDRLIELLTDMNKELPDGPVTSPKKVQFREDQSGPRDGEEASNKFSIVGESDDALDNASRLVELFKTTIPSINHCSLDESLNHCSLDESLISTASEMLGIGFLDLNLTREEPSTDGPAQQAKSSDCKRDGKSGDTSPLPVESSAMPRSFPVVAAFPEKENNKPRSTASTKTGSNEALASTAATTTSKSLVKAAQEAKSLGDQDSTNTIEDIKNVPLKKNSSNKSNFLDRSDSLLHPIVEEAAAKPAQSKDAAADVKCSRESVTSLLSVVGQRSFDFNSNHSLMSIEVALAQQSEPSAMEHDGEAASSPLLPVVAASPENKKPSFMAPMDTGKKTTSGSTNTIYTPKKASKSAQAGRSPRVQRVKNILKDIKNIPLKRRDSDMKKKHHRSKSSQFVKMAEEDKSEESSSSKHLNVDESDDALDQSNQLVGIFKAKILNRFSGLDESAISKASEMPSIGQDVPLDLSREEDFSKATSDEPVAPTNPTEGLTNQSSFGFTSISVETTTAQQTESAGWKIDGKPKGRSRLPVGLSARSPSLPVVATLPEVENNNHTFSAPIETGSKVSLKSLFKPGQEARSRKSQGVRNVINDIKHVPVESNSRNSKNNAPNWSNSPHFDKVTVENRKTSSPGREKVSVNEIEEPFVADFSYKAAIGSTSPETSMTTSSNDITWDSFTSKDNPFGVAADGGGVQCKLVTEAVNCVGNVASTSGMRICEWCRKGGTDDPEIAKRLMICSRCQVTYYCSSACQSKDWINGHAKRCQPASVETQ